MKKILTLFMATVVAMSMMAIPQVKKAGNKTKPVSHEQFEAKTPAQVKVKEMHKASLVERAAVRPASAKKVVPATIAAPKKIANSVSEVITLHFDGFSVLPEWYEESGDWYMACTDAEGWIVKFDILNPSYVGTFTTEDFDLEYSYMYTPDGGIVDYIEIECTITEEKKSEYLTVLSLEATIEGSDGNTYIVTCVQNFLVAKEVIENTISDATLEFDGSSEFVLAGKNEVLDLNLDVYATWPVGRFTKGECNMENTKVLYNGVEQDLNNPELVVTTAVNEEGKAGYAANLSFYNQDTAQHVVEIFAPLAEPTDTVEIQMINLQVDDSWAMYFGWVYYTAVDSNWDIYAGVAGFEAAEGTWSGEDVMLYVTNQQTGEATEAIYAKATVVEDEEKGWMATFEGVCVDGKYYVVNMHFEIPEPTKTVELHFETSAKASFYPDLGNDLMLSNDNGDYYIALDIYDVPMGSEFTYDQMDTYYTQLIDWNNMVEIQIADVQGVVYQRNDTTFMEAQVIGFDAVLYDVVLWHTVPTPSEVVELTVDAAFDNQIENQGYYTLHGQANESELLVAMSPITSEVEGTYVNDGMFGGFGTGEYDFYANSTYVAQPIGYDEYGDMQFDVYSVEKGTLTVTMDEEDNILAHASVICSNGVQYEITMNSVFEKPHLEYDAEYGVERIYTTDDIAEAEYDADYGMAFWKVTAADGSDLCALYFFIEEPDAELVIPEGEYAINDSWDYGTVLASTGYDPYNGAAPSLYATLDGEYLNIPLWFMVDGTVTVKHVDGQLSIEVNALNSYDQEVHIVYNGESQPEIEWIEMPLEITNLTTMELPVGDVTYLQLMGRDDMNDADVMIYLNNYTGEEKAYEVNVESSLMTFGGLELTVMDGSITKSVDPEKGDVFAGTVHASVVEEGATMYVEFALTMYAAPAIELVIEDAEAIVDETTGTLLFTASWTDTTTMVAYPVMVTVAGFEDVEYKEYEGAQISELQIGDDDNWYDYAVANAVAVIKDGNAVVLEGEYTSWNTGATYYVYAEGVMQGGEDPDPEYMVIEDEITNLVIDLENMAIIGGPSTMWQVEVFLGLAEDDNMDGQWSLSPESSVAVMGFDARIIDGYVYDIDVNAPAAKAVLYVEDSGFFYEYKLTMTNTPTEAIVVVVEDATVQIDTIPLFGDQVDYALKMTADWTYAEDGVTYPVLVEVPVYYPEAIEPSEMTCTVTIGGWGENDPWLGFGEGTLTIITVDGVVTAKGIIANPYTGVAFDVTVSGKLPQGPGTGIDNVQVEVKTVKMIQNGQLIINRNGKAYNAIGVQVK